MPLLNRHRATRFPPLLAGAYAAIWLSGCALGVQGPPAPSPLDSIVARGALADLQAKYLAAVIARRPEVAVAANFPVKSLVSPLMALDDRAQARANQRLAIQFDEVNARALSPRDYAALQTIRWELDMETEAASYAELDFSVLSPRRTTLRQVVAVLLEHPLESSPQFERYLYLLESLTFWLEDARVALGERARRGHHPPLDAVLDFSRFLRRFRELEIQGALRVADDRLVHTDSVGRDRFRQYERETLEQRVRPQLDSLQRFLDGDVLSTATTRPGLWQQVGGKEYYRHLLRKRLGLDVEPEEAHRAGLAMLQRLDSLKRVLRTRMGWNKGEAEFVRALQEEVRPPASDLIDAVERTLRAVGDSLGTRIGGAAVPVPRVRMATSLEALLHPEGLAIPATYVDSAATLVVTPWWGSRDAQLEGAALTFRYGWPGRTLASARAYWADTVSPIIVVHPAQTTQAGWGEYGASLAGEMGFYAEPRAAYGRLMRESLCAAWLVVDTGVHYFGWGKPQALALLRLHSIASDAELDSLFTDRVVQDPGGAGAEAIGLREISAMRQWMRQRLGKDFSAAEWHAELLSLGPVPLPVLAAHLEWWAWERDRVRRQREQGAKRR